MAHLRQAYTRQYFKYILKYNEDLDFIFHEPPSDVELQAFGRDPNKGPTIDNPQFDVKKGLRSEWNKHLLNLMIANFKEKLPDVVAQTTKGTVPPRSDDYYTSLFSERFQRLAKIWKQGQPRKTVEGIDETPEQIEERVVTMRNEVAKSQRHLTRRLYVSD